MGRNHRRHFLLSAFAIAILTTCISLPGQAAPYYQGKNIEILGESRVGGGTDTMARLTAKIIAKYIPGHPLIVVRAMPGGAGAIANNIFYEKGKPDGLHLLQNSSSPISMQLRDKTIATYDLRKLKHIGHVTRGGNVLLVRKAVKNRLFDPAGKPVVIGTKEGEETWLAMALWGQEYLGWNVRYIPGYSGSSDFELAYRRGEIDMFGTSNAYMIKRLLDEGNTEIIVQNGSYKAKERRFVRRPDFPEIPTFEEMLGKKKPGGLPWQSYMVWLGAKLVDKSLSAPRGTPDKYVSILRRAYGKMGQDPQFDDLMKKLVSPIYDVGVGSETTEILNEVLGAPQAAIDFSVELQKKHGVTAK